MRIRAWNFSDSFSGMDLCDDDEFGDDVLLLLM